MGAQVEVSCRCGQVRGTVTEATPEAVNHVQCYCDDCQAYLHWLGRGDLLNAIGGSEIVQVAPAALRFNQGQERIRGVRLQAKGLHRWYASCCNTPVGNTLTPALPFVGILVQAFAANPAQIEQAFGPARGGMFGKFAVGEAPKGSTRINLGLLGGAILRLLRWRIAGKAWPHPFFDDSTKAARYPLQTLSDAEREALRPLCGPRTAES